MQTLRGLALLTREETIKLLRECLGVEEKINKYYKKITSSAKADVRDMVWEMLKDKKKHVELVKLLLQKQGVRVR